METASFKTRQHVTVKRAHAVTSSSVKRRAPRAALAGMPLAPFSGLFVTVANLARQPASLSGGKATTEESPRTLLGRFGRAVRLAVLLVPLVLVAAILWVIWTRTGDVPYWDEWEFAGLDHRLWQGTLRFHDIVALHATAHRIILPRLIGLTLSILTNFNRQIAMTFDLGIAIASACLLFWCIRRTLGSLTAALALVVPLSLLFFSLSQFANWFAPFQIQFILTSFGVVCCLSGFVAAPESRRGFALAIVGALIGSSSGLHGVLIWLAFLPGALYAGVRKAVIWIGCAMVVWVLYFQHFPHQPTRLPIGSDVIYTLAYLGGPVEYPDAALALLAGAFSFALLLGNVAAFWWRHRSLRPIAPWLQLSAFVLGCAQATAQGRVFMGPQQALASRYEAFTVLWWIALVVIMVVNMMERLTEHQAPGRRAYASRLAIIGVNLSALLLIVVGLIPVNIAGLRQALLWQDVQRLHQDAIRDYRSASDSCLELYYPWPDDLRQRVRFLEQHRLGIFSSVDRSGQIAASSASVCQKPYHGFIDNAAPLLTGRWVALAEPAN
jgi:hypothetical protein